MTLVKRGLDYEHIRWRFSTNEALSLEVCCKSDVLNPRQCAPAGNGKVLRLAIRRCGDIR